jgi:hypothetical protein
VNGSVCLRVNQIAYGFRLSQLESLVCNSTKREFSGIGQASAQLQSGIDNRSQQTGEP